MATDLQSYAKLHKLLLIPYTPQMRIGARGWWGERGGEEERRGREEERSVQGGEQEDRRAK